MTPDTAEQSLLGAMLLSSEAIAEAIDVLDSGDFRRRRHLLIFEAIMDLYLRGEPADPVTVIPELDRRGKLNQLGGAPYLHTLISTVPDASQARHYAEIIVSHKEQQS